VAARYLIRYKKIIINLIGALILLILLYSIFIKELLVNRIAKELEPLDKLYYSEIFKNGDLALSIAALILLASLFLYEPIKKIL